MFSLVQLLYGEGNLLISLEDIPMTADTPRGMSSPSYEGLGIVPGSCTLSLIPSDPAPGSNVLSNPGMVQYPGYNIVTFVALVTISIIFVAMVAATVVSVVFASRRVMSAAAVSNMMVVMPLLLCFVLLW